ncbi:MAG: hypothetical protein J6S14_02230 [Clostridia bacterium]|nr:hypothetical protein [Clostridia bacterium]
MSKEYISREELKAAFEEDGHLSAYVEEMIDSVEDKIDAEEIERLKCREKFLEFLWENVRQDMQVLLDAYKRRQQK